jgi:hypothetical protein
MLSDNSTCKITVAPSDFSNAILRILTKIFIHHSGEMDFYNNLKTAAKILAWK